MLKNAYDHGTIWLSTAYIDIAAILLLEASQVPTSAFTLFASGGATTSLQKSRGDARKLVAGPDSIWLFPQYRNGHHVLVIAYPARRHMLYSDSLNYGASYRREILHVCLQGSCDWVDSL